ncbi:hypothetical protein D3C87_2089060 [compost metagenome]
MRLQVPPDGRIERAEGLVHQQDIGVSDQGSRQADALLHATGQFMGIVLAPALQPHRLQLHGGGRMTDRFRFAA